MTSTHTPITDYSDSAIALLKSKGVFFSIGMTTEGHPYVRVTLPKSLEVKVFVNKEDRLSGAFADAVKAVRAELYS